MAYAANLEALYDKRCRERPMCRSAALWTRVVPKIRNGYGQKPAERRAGRSLRRIYVRTEKSTSHPISQAGCASYISCGRDDVGIVPYIVWGKRCLLFQRFLNSHGDGSVGHQEQIQLLQPGAKTPSGQNVRVVWVRSLSYNIKY